MDYTVNTLLRTGLLRIRSIINPNYLPYSPFLLFSLCQAGHVTNVIYYSYFNTAVNQFLIERGVLGIHDGEVVGFVVDSGCAYFSSISFPDTVHAGIRVAKLGNSSVRYEIALYRNGDPLPCAAGHFVHVYVERSSNRPVPIPAQVRNVLATIRSAESTN